MYYNIRTNEILNNMPLNGRFDDGTLVQGLEFTDINTQKLCGILPIISDTPSQPDNTVENLNERQVSIDLVANTVSIVRSWAPITTQTVSVPETISARQIRLWLIENNISLTSVEYIINTIVDEKLREKTLVEWEYAPYIERNHPLVNTLGESLGLSIEQIDLAFLQASQI